MLSILVFLFVIAIILTCLKSRLSIFVFPDGVKVTTLEPFDNEIVSENKTTCDNKYAHLICLMKESTFEYYNMRIALGLECT